MKITIDKGMMTNIKLNVKELQVKNTISIKTVQSSNYALLYSLSKGYDINVDDLIKNDSWSKLSIPVDSYCIDVDVQFDEVTFPARLMDINVVKKQTSECTYNLEYVLNFEKEYDKSDIDFILPYLKAREPIETFDEPEDGKKKKKKSSPIATFPVVITDEDEETEG